MARPRSFDDVTVLDAAMHAFRREGYHHLSVGRLERATGLAASSLYNAYGDKAGLFRRSMQHYVDTFVAPRLAAYAGPEATLEDLEGLFLSLFESPLNDGFGCLVTNSAGELGGDSLVAEAVADVVQDITDHLKDVLLREVGSEAEAMALVMLYKGLLVLSRAGLVENGHREAVQYQFARLRALREGQP
jgi:TetR/AcrR family transcriptional repressor of nem operon